MINEVLFMQMRIFGMLCKAHGLSSKEGNRIFDQYDIWNYIDECYELFHVSGDEYVANEVNKVLKLKGAFA